jgi:hypothetical protein
MQEHPYSVVYIDWNVVDTRPEGLQERFPQKLRTSSTIQRNSGSI